MNINPYSTHTQILILNGLYFNNGNEKRAYQNLQDTAKVIPRGKLIALYVYVSKKGSLKSATSVSPKETKKKKAKVS